MEIKTDLLLKDLSERTRTNLDSSREFFKRTNAELNQRPASRSWSALECFEHLNRYGDFYLPEIERAINSSGRPPDENFKSGLLGDYFAKMMLPREKLNKIKTFKDKDPFGCNLDKTTIEKFISQQEHLLDLLCEASKVSLTRTKTAISISKLLKLRLGDTFRVVVYHNERHLVQAQKALTANKTNQPSS